MRGPGVRPLDPSTEADNIQSFAELKRLCDTSAAPLLTQSDMRTITYIILIVACLVMQALAGCYPLEGMIPSSQIYAV